MAIISTNDIFPGSVLKEDLYHIESGKILLKKGELCTEEKIELLESSGIDSVFKGTNPFEIAEFLFDVDHKSITLNNTMIGKVFPTPLLDRKKRILVEANVAIAESFMRIILKSGGVVYQVKNAKEINSSVADEFIAKASELSATSDSNSKVDSNNTAPLDKAEIQNKNYDFDKSVETIAEGTQINSDYVDNDLAKRKKPLKVEIVPDAVLLEMGVKDPLAVRTESYKATFYETYKELLKVVSVLFKEIASNSNQKVDIQIRAICNRIVNTLIADKNLVMNLTTLRSDENDYLVQHSLHVAIYAINIGCSIGYSQSQIFELTYGALLADVGMVKVNNEVLSKKSIFTNEERRLIEKHPSYSLDYLNLIKGLPASLPYIIYQSHEKLDGTGYPKNRPAFLIHEFAKIISIADIFDSLCSNRPWRRAMAPYKAMEEIIRMAGQKKIDGKIIRQWLFSISLFPIGSYVNLSDSSIAKVISASPTDFTRPNLRAMKRNGADLTPPPTIVLSEDKSLKITSALSPADLQYNALEGF